MNKYFTDIMNFIFPPHCPACEAYVETYGGWCETCLTATLKLERMPLNVDMVRTVYAAWALGDYRGTLGRLVRRLKFQHDRSVLPQLHTFVRMAERKFPNELLAVDAVAAVPLHKNREKERGFNQAELIFSPCFEFEKLLDRIRETKPQYELNAEERRKNLKGAFAIADGAEVKGKTILLIDDIMTTGTTFLECAKVLKKEGAEKVFVLALASDR